MPAHPVPTMPETKKKWKDLTYDQRIDRLLDVVLNQARIIEGLERVQSDVLIHRHDKEGRLVVVRGIGGGRTSDPISNEVGPNPFYDIDFSS